MGFFSNFFQSTVGKVITIAAAVAVTAFTGGAAAGLFGLAQGAGGFIAAAAGLSGAAAAAVGLAGSLVAAALVTSALISRSPTDPLAGTNMSLAEVLQGTRVLSSAQTSNSLPWVIGNAYLSGQVFDTVLSTDQQTIWYAIAISEVGSNQTFAFDLQKTYWGDKLIAFDGTDTTKVASLTDNAGTVDTKIAGNVFMYFYTNGSSSGQNTSRTAIDVMSDAGIPAGNRWPASNTVFQTAFVIVKIIYNQTAGVTGLVSPKFRITSNAAYQKPGTIWYEYMTNTRFGLGFPAAIVDQTSANAWDAYADEVITYTPAAGGSATQPRYRLNGVIDTKQRFRSNLDLIMANADGFLRFDELNNKWQVLPNQAGTSVFSFSDDNIIGAFTFSPKPLKDSYTSAIISFPDAAIRDQQNNVYLDVPNNLLTPNIPYNPLSLTYALTTDSIQAQYLANRLLEQAQEDLVIQFNASFNAAGIQAGDVIDVTNSTFGWVGKLFRVAEVREQMDDSFGLSVNLLCVEYNAAVYDNFSITQFTPAPNTNLADPTFFGTLVAPTITNALPTTSVPSFDVNITVPSAGVANEMDIFYGNSNNPLLASLLAALPNPSSGAYAQSSTLVYTTSTLPAGTYYFFSRAKNTISQSAFSSPSNPFVWDPQPASTSSGVSINAQWQPAVVLVPANSSNVATQVGQTTALSLYLGTALLNFSNVNNDPAMPNNSWRIDTVNISTGLTLTGPVAGATTATWTVADMTVSSGTLTVSLRYKNNAGVVTSIGGTLVGFTEVVQATGGASAYLNQSPLVIYQNADGTFPTVASNLVFSINNAGTIITKTQPITPDSSGFITYGTATGDAGITVTTTGAGTRVGSVNFTQTSSGISLTGVVQIALLAPTNTTYTIYRRSATTAPETAPATPTGGVLNTATGFISTLPVGWSASIPAGTNVLYQSQITINYQRGTGLFTITAAWSSPTQSSQTLSNGASYSWNLNGSLYIPRVVTATVYYQFTATDTNPPATPTGGTISLFANAFTVTAPAPWLSTYNQDTYNLTYSSTATLYSVSDTQNYTPSWGVPGFIYNPAGKIASVFIVRLGAQPAIVPAPLNLELPSVFLRNQPRYGDAVVVQYSNPQTYVSFVYNGSGWAQAASFINGDQVISGTLTAAQIKAATITGDKIAAGTIAASNLIVNQLSAITANMGTLTSGTITGGSITSNTSLTVGSSPAISGTTMSGSGAIINPTGTGTFALGNANTNLTFNGTQITANGRFVGGGNVLQDGTNIITNGTNQLTVGTINSGQVTNGNRYTYAASLTTTRTLDF